MSPLWQLTLARFREFYREPAALFWVYGFPLILAFVFIPFAIEAVWVFWPSLLVSIFLAVGAKPILGLFGAGFSDASWVLIVLLVGHVISAATGSVGYLMTLTGHQREAAHVYGGVAILHLAVSAAAIPLLGTIGAAMAVSFSVSVWNLWLHRLVVRRLGIHPSIFARPPRLGGRHA